MLVRKRDGRFVEWDKTKIDIAVSKACKELGVNPIILEYEPQVTSENDQHQPYVDIEQIQDDVEILLMKEDPQVAQAYIRYRHERMMQRNVGHNILDDIARITNLKAVDNENGRDNANVNEDVTMGWMLHAGEIATKAYFSQFRLKSEWLIAHIKAFIHIHDLAWYDKSINCLQIDVGTLMSRRITDEELEKKFHEEMLKHNDTNIAGAITHKFELDHSTFSTGHGTIRIPKTFKTAMGLTAVIIQANQNDNFGGQGVPNIDYQLEKFVHTDFIKEMRSALYECLYIANKLTENVTDVIKEKLEEIVDPFNNTDKVQEVVGKFVPPNMAKRIVEVGYSNTVENVMQSTEGFIHNLNTMSSRAGA
jgi:ribonucleoside-triphosphate reductase